jgi:hypothetical protein
VASSTWITPTPYVPRSTENENAIVADVAFVDINWFVRIWQTKSHICACSQSPGIAAAGAILLDHNKPI